MAVTEQVLNIAAQMRKRLDQYVDGTTRELTAAWADAWDEISGEWEDAVTDLAASSIDGRWPSPNQVVRAERAARAVESTEKVLSELYADASGTISRTLPTVTSQAAEWQSKMIGAQMPVQAGPAAVSGVAFNRVDPAQLQAIVYRSTQQITALTIPLSAEATAAVQSELIRGIAVGEHPNRAARRMLQRVEGRFNGGLSRAINISRTEMLDAHRNAAWAQDLANADVLQKWEWLATLDSRTCASCLVQHGNRFELDVPGPNDHQQGRCARVPVTKTWEELGFSGIEEPPGSGLPDSKSWFDAQSDAVKRGILGPTRLQMLDAGEISWDDLSAVHPNAGWRDSYGVPSISDLRSGQGATGTIDGMPYTLNPQHDTLQGQWDFFGGRAVGYESLDEFVPDAAKAMRSAANESVKIDLSEDALESVLNDGRMKTMWEVNPENRAGNYVGVRDNYEKRIMGVPDGVPDAQRPIYGYQQADGGRTAYGDVTLELRDSVRGRTTITGGDSLNFETPVVRLSDVAGATDERLALSSGMNLAKDYDPLFRWQYVESQVHGGVTLSDISSITVSKSRWSALPESVRKKATDAGIRVNFR